jgi:hypothetical protein
VLAATTLLPARLFAYSFSGEKWSLHSVTMQLQLGSSSVLIDGNTSWGSAAEDALARWNAVLTNVQFTVVRDSTAARASGNSLNNVFWSSTVYGETWGSRVLAITLTRFDSRSRYSEADVLFITAT